MGLGGEGPPDAAGAPPEVEVGVAPAEPGGVVPALGDAVVRRDSLFLILVSIPHQRARGSRGARAAVEQRN